MDLKSSIQTTLDGKVLLDIEVQPGASRQGLVGYNEWRNRIQIAVKAPAEKGRANHAVCNLLSTIFGTDVQIESGHTSRMKRIVISGMEAAQVIKALEVWE